MDAEDVPHQKKIKNWLLIIFDAFDEICRRIKVEEQKALKQVVGSYEGKISDYEKVQKAYHDIQSRFKFTENTKDNRAIVESELILRLGKLRFDVKCNEENNPPDTIGIIARVFYGRENKKWEYKYIDLHFGDGITQTFL